MAFNYYGCVKILFEDELWDRLRCRVSSMLVEIAYTVFVVKKIWYYQDLGGAKQQRVNKEVS